MQITMIAGLVLIGTLCGYLVTVFLFTHGRLKHIRSVIDAENNKDKGLLRQQIDNEQSNGVQLEQRIAEYLLTITEKDERILLLEKEVSHLQTQLEILDFLKTERAQQQQLNDKLQDRCITLEKLVSGYSVKTSEQRKLYEEKLALLSDAKESLSQEFENVSHRIFDTTTEKMNTLNQDSIKQLLDPLKEQIIGFKQRVERVYDSESRDRRTLYDEITNLKELNRKINDEAANLTKALKGDAQKQGAWGELVLERILEESGLRNGHEYETQTSFTDEEGLRKRPDIIVHLPDDKDIIIDSKVSLVSYERYLTAESAREQKKGLLHHIASVKAHIKELAEKSYDEIKEIHTLDYVLMFIPIESAFVAAIEGDRHLFNEAYTKNIIIVSPSTLLVTLRTIHNIWRYERQNTNAQEIAEKAGRLYDKFVMFLEAMDEIDKHLVKTRMAFDTACSRLSRGKGNLISQTETIKRLGAKTKKQLPRRYAAENKKLLDIIDDKD